MENKITVCKIQNKLDNCNKPLIGLEYLLEIDCKRATFAHYCCLLCDKQGDFPALLIHLLSQNHQLYYLVSKRSGNYSTITLKYLAYCQPTTLLKKMCR